LANGIGHFRKDILTTTWKMNEHSMKSTEVWQELNSKLQALQATSHWQRIHYRAVKNWLTLYKYSAQATRLEQIKGYLEAFFHLKEVEDWLGMKAILQVEVDDSSYELHEQLHIWGYYQEQTDAYTQLLNRLDSGLDSTILSGLGITSHTLGKYEQAIGYYKRDLEIAEQLVDVDREVSALSNMALAYHFLQEYSVAQEYHDRCLAKVDQIDDLAKRGAVFGNLGLTYKAQKNDEKALECFERHLALARQAKNQEGQGAALGNLGSLYRRLGRIDDGRGCYEEYLAITVGMGDRWSEGAALHGLSNLQRDQGDLPAALLSALRSLAIFSDLNVPMDKTIGLVRRIRENLEKGVYQNMLADCLATGLVKSDANRVTMILAKSQLIE
jgi:tetratricopeptide (TPR) repeat protein